MTNLLIEKGKGRAGFLRTGVHCGGEKGQQGILSHLILNHENSSFSMDLMSTQNRLMPNMEDLGQGCPSHSRYGSYNRALIERSSPWQP